MAYTPPSIDASTLASNTIEYEHHEVHAGKHYFLDNVVDQSINHVYDIQWTTPDTTKWGHLSFSFQCEAETEWYVYEKVSINTAGTTLVAMNNDRNSTNTSGMTIAGISNTSVADANADTDPTGATTIAHGIVGAGRRATGLEARGREIILDQNQIYCFRFIANAAGYTNFVINWYEHTNKS